ncbi:hypothetical protein [Oerskovia enterophila]|uniref:hypothetical protein n=1 Tax=Oerskovia enterophila TaxID=43678 RepID=UPI0033975994
MENDFREDEPPSGTPGLSPAQARAALEGLDADGATLAERAVTPWWYHLTLGTIVAVIICTQALPSPASLVTLPVALFALPVLVLVYRRRYGLWFSQPAGPRSKRIYQVLLATVVLCFGAMLIVRFTEIEYTWVLVPASVGFLAAVVLGPLYDQAFRRELAGQGSEDR